MIVAVVIARTAGLDRMRSGFGLTCFRRRAISGASRWPRGSSTRSQSSWPGRPGSVFA